MIILNKLKIIEISINSNILTLNHEVVLADFNSIRADIFKQKETQGEQSEKSFMRGNSQDSWNKISFLVIHSCGQDR